MIKKKKKHNTHYKDNNILGSLSSYQFYHSANFQFSIIHVHMPNSTHLINRQELDNMTTNNTSVTPINLLIIK